MLGPRVHCRRLCYPRCVCVCVRARVKMTSPICFSTEPFPAIMTAQMGVLWLELSVYGRPAHVLDTSAGVNAVEAIYAMFAELKELEKEWNLPENKHPIFKDFKVLYCMWWVKL